MAICRLTQGNFCYYITCTGCMLVFNNFTLLDTLCFLTTEITGYVGSHWFILALRADFNLCTEYLGKVIMLIIVFYAQGTDVADAQ